MNELKVFVMDLGWSGNIVVIEKDEASARALMENCENYCASKEITVLDIKQGLVVYNLGDL